MISRLAAAQLRSLSRVWLQSNLAHWNNVLDNQLVILNDHPIDDQAEDFLFGLEARVDERVPNAVTERS